MQTLQTANYQVLGLFNEAMAKASKTVAETQKIDLILSEETSFFFNKSLDISKSVVAVMDANFEKEQQDNKDEATKPVR
jgi:Skp family chaperone for outer membrane proteins